MKKLNLKDEEVMALLDNLECNGYDEEILKGEEATRKKRTTFYTCERTYKCNGKIYKAIWECASKFDGQYACNDLEDVKEFYEM